MTTNAIRAFVARGGLANRVYALTPHNTNDFSVRPGMLYVTVGGVVAYVNDDDTVVNLTLAAGWHPLQPKRINSTNTTATGLVGAI